MRDGVRELVGALVVCAAWWVLLLVWVRPDTIAGLDRSWLLLFPGDDTGRLSHEVLQLGRDGWGEGDTVVIVGPSSTREGVKLAALQRRIRERAGSEVRVVDLSANMLTLLEYAAILDALPSGLSGVVSVTVSPQILAKTNAADQARISSSAEMRLGWVSPARDRELRALGLDVGSRTGIYAIDARSFLLARVEVPLRRILRGDVHHRRHRTHAEPKGHIRHQRHKLRSKLESYDASEGPALALLDRTLTAFAERSASVSFAVIEQTAVPGALRDALGPHGVDRYRSAVAAFVGGRSDTTYADLNGVLDARDFHDLVHLGADDGKRRFTGALARHLARSLERAPHGKEP